MLPEIAAAPSRHHQDALLVGHFEEFLGFEFAFQPDRVQSQIMHVVEFIGQSLWGLAQHHVRSPAAAANEDILAVDLEQPLRAIRRRLRDFRRDFANAEPRMRRIGNLAVHFE